MTTAIDTNIFVALWDEDPGVASAARAALEAAFQRGNLTVAAPVFAELIAAPGRTENFVGAFFADTGIVIDWELEEAIWRSAWTPASVRAAPWTWIRSPSREASASSRRPWTVFRPGCRCQPAKAVPR